MSTVRPLRTVSRAPDLIQRLTVSSDFASFADADFAEGTVLQELPDRPLGEPKALDGILDGNERGQRLARLGGS